MVETEAVGLGLGTIDQVVPLSRSVSVWAPVAEPMKANPATMQLVAFGQETPVSSTSEAFVGLGVVMIAHWVPVHRSASERALVPPRLPAAMQADPAHASPKKSALAPAGWVVAAVRLAGVPVHAARPAAR